MQEIVQICLNDWDFGFVLCCCYRQVDTMALCTGFGVQSVSYFYVKIDDKPLCAADFPLEWLT